MKKMIGIVVALTVAFGAYSFIVAHRVIEVDDASPVVANVPAANDTATNPSTTVNAATTPTEVTVHADVRPASAGVIAAGDFRAHAHEAIGRALLIRHANGTITLRFEDFETINGPDLHIYLATDFKPRAFVDLGPIRATKGNVNYEVPPGIDLTKYRYVLVWCVSFRVLFSTAELQLQ